MTARLCALPLVLLLAACPGGESLELAGAAGRFELDGDGRRFHAGAAIASYCDVDSSITIVSLLDESSAGVAARLRWPAAGGPDSLRVGRRLLSVGSATLAYRSRRDSVAPALTADSGTAALSGNDEVSGVAYGWAATSDTTVTRLAARFAGVPVERRCAESRP